MARHCPCCNNTLSFELFLSAATNPGRQWVCERCGQVLKKDMSLIFGAFVLFILSIAFPVIFIVGLLERVQNPKNPAQVMLGVTKPTAFLIVLGVLLGLA